MQDDSASRNDWVDAIKSVISVEGSDEADRVLTAAVDEARKQGARLPFAANTAYINTIHPNEQPAYPATAFSSARCGRRSAGTRRRS